MGKGQRPSEYGRHAGEEVRPLHVHLAMDSHRLTKLITSRLSEDVRLQLGSFDITARAPETAIRQEKKAHRPTLDIPVIEVTKPHANGTSALPHLFCAQTLNLIAVQLRTAEEVESAARAIREKRPSRR